MITLSFPLEFPKWNNEATEQETIIFLIGLLAYLEPSLVVESGTYRGHFALAASITLPSSRVLTCDPVDYSVQRLSNLEYFHQDFEDMLEGLNERSIGFAFIDSGPIPGPEPGTFLVEDEVRWRHYQAVKPYMAPGGLIVVHDMNNRDWYKADQILAEASLYLPAGRGITIKQVKHG